MQNTETLVRGLLRDSQNLLLVTTHELQFATLPTSSSNCLTVFHQHTFGTKDNKHRNLTIRLGYGQIALLQ